MWNLIMCKIDYKKHATVPVYDTAVYEGFHHMHYTQILNKR